MHCPIVSCFNGALFMGPQLRGKHWACRCKCPRSHNFKKCSVLKTSDKKGLKSFELCCYRRILRIISTDKKRIEFVLQNINCENRLLNVIYPRQLSFIGHTLGMAALKETLLTGMFIGKRGRGKPKSRLRPHQRIKYING